MAGGRGAGRVESTYFAAAILEGRATLHLVYRLVIRASMYIAVAGAAAPGSGPWRTALPAFVVVDLVTWRILIRDNRFGLWWRMPLDCIDIAFWSLSPLPTSGGYDISMLVGIPLSIESGFRLGAVAALVPVVAGASIGSFRALAGEPALPFTACWMALGVGLGISLYAYCRRMDTQAEAERHRRQAADARWAFMVGQNDVAMGADSVVDLLEGVVPVLGRPGTDSALWRLADGWKGRLASDTAAHSSYLRVSLLGWETAHNRHPDLSSRVELHLGEGVGTEILTGRQVADLHQALDAADLRGVVPVARVGREGVERRPGAALGLDIGGRVLRVAADRAAAVRPVDVGPVTYGLIAGLLFGTIAPRSGAVPVSWVCLAVGVCGAAAWWSHRRLVVDGPAARAAILRVAVGAAIAITLLTNPMVTLPVNADGESQYLCLGVMLLAFLGGMYSHGLARNELAVLGAGALVSTLLAVVLTPTSLDPRSLIVTLIQVTSPYPICRHISRSLGRATRRHQEATAEEDERARQEAFQQGRASVLDLVRAARDDARAQLSAVADGLDPSLRSLVGSRLEEVDRRLASLTPVG